MMLLSWDDGVRSTARLPDGYALNDNMGVLSPALLSSGLAQL
jgi:hypothetical protein